MPKPKIIKLNLLSNAYDYLNESLVCLARAREEDDQNSWKSSILNMTFSIELMLKERLRKEHPLLLLSDINKYRQISRETKTVNWTVLTERLKLVLGEEFIALDAGRLNLAKRLRNQMLHYDVLLEFPGVYHDYANLLNFVSDFYNKYLRNDDDDYLHNHIHENLWKLEDNLSHAFVDKIVYYNNIFMPAWLKEEIISEQTRTTLIIDGKEYKRIPYGSVIEQKSLSISDYFIRPCGDCNVAKEQIHLAGCDHERCPKCHLQLLSCYCFPDDYEKTEWHNLAKEMLNIPKPDQS